MGAQLKNDMQNYLSYTFRPGKSPKSRTHESARSTVNANTLLNTRARPLKPLFDSDYVKPAENWRVLQDSSLQKNAVFKDALARYEATLQNDKENDSRFFHTYNERLERMNDESKLEKEKKAKQQQDYKETILKQMELKTEEKQAYVEESKKQQPTGFTPESPEGQLNLLKMKKKHNAH